MFLQLISLKRAVLCKEMMSKGWATFILQCGIYSLRHPVFWTTPAEDFATRWHSRICLEGLHHHRHLTHQCRSHQSRGEVLGRCHQRWAWSPSILHFFSISLRWGVIGIHTQCLRQNKLQTANNQYWNNIALKSVFFRFSLGRSQLADRWHAGLMLGSEVLISVAGLLSCRNSWASLIWSWVSLTRSLLYT